jgi:hypothetical protein
MNQSRLSPEEQNLLFALSKKAGAQPTSGGQSMNTMEDQSMGQPQQQPGPSLQMQPGDKMDPNEAMQIIMSKATGQQLSQTKSGQPALQKPHWYPFAAMFGAKQNVPITEPNYADVVAHEGLAEQLPSNLPRMKDGKAFVSEDVYKNALLTLSKKKPTQKDIKGVDAFGEAFLAKAGSPEQVQAWRELPYESKSELIKQLPGYRTQRSEYFQDKGTTSDGRSVQMDVTTNQWYIDGKQVSPSEVGRTVPRLRPQLADSQVNEVTKLLDARTQLARVSELFDPAAVGPVEDRIQSFSRMTGIDLGTLKGAASLTDSKARLNTVMSSAINDYIKAITGAQMSEIEARRIMNALPQPGAAQEAFLPALQEIQKITDMKLNNRISVLKSQGTIGIEDIEDTAQKPTKGSSKASEPSSNVVVDTAVTNYFTKNKIKDTPANRAWARKKLGI